MDPTIALLAVLVAISAGALAYVFLFQQIEVEKKTTSRFKRVQAAETDHVNIKAARDRVQELSKRRKSMQDSLRDMEKKQNEKAKKAKNVSLRDKLVQAGLAISVRQFHLLSAGASALATLIALLYDLSLITALLIGAVVALGLPRWVLAFILKRRQKKFLEEFPNALDVMCRSIKSGLPLNDAVRLIASDGQEPVKTEFQRVVDAQQVGIGIPQGIERMMLTMPLFEVSFFSTVINIQAQAGGNLSEALSNLSKVLRDRKKMRAKVNALSMEAKASAVIIGALPFIVMLLVHFTSPDYLAVLFTDMRGHIILGASGLWMLIGIFIMRQMINFDI
ncbi:type II secretion system F family protein [Agrobacterium tumefaciens]|uniref:Component of type IV pilus, CtpH n=1 Tax=Agrobacterium tumefaciens TaxID=358 RepID=A0A2L2L7F5_AGRTU|nr:MULTISPECIES: type II secretion system F family protein [Agrobacterium]MCZ7494285.1 type II secretion system F family protein [Rhizobium rhizogenes]AVH40251.1 component of type IV pilus, CtpH [Agrobacterium tumefaciens]NSY94228.1 type II secretion system F family protein [Agrobacterium tumefaciens]NSZ02882.1 type II secretion system F family protein [Agrobacterium tumefaciens]NSZ41084.1 type II secretion system F family protein [Agrobacterium tumefaciens]